ncbi:MAG: hypothetical protein HYW02_07795 [Deltaproteobacteria bacterium]|nr:hypothetical protein [Deltaproteobacteria bacterium]MBI2501338.1 hypothetical protein [Deltaproteobacteria bacterium]
MKKNINILFVVIALTFFVAPLALSKSGPHSKKGSSSKKKITSSQKYASDRQGEFQAGSGIGITFNNPALDLRLDTEYFVTNNISAGFDFDIVFHGATTFAFDAVGRYHLDIQQQPRLVPYAGMGLGAIINTNGAGGFDILLPNLGCRYEVLPNQLFIGPDLGVHILTDFSDTTWDVTFLFVNALYRF